MTDITTGPGEPEAASTTAADLEASNAAVGAVSTAEQLRYIHQQAADARVNVEIETEGMTLNIGPQHPATHGTLRIIAKLDGCLLYTSPSPRDRG